MSQTGKLGTNESQLGNVLLAYAGADPTLPAIGVRNGRLGSQLGNLILALGGTVGAKVINLFAESTIGISDSVGLDPELVGHAPPNWVLGSADWLLGDAQPAFTGASETEPDIGTKSGRLGLQLGMLAPGLAGTVTSHVINLYASSVLDLDQTAVCTPAFVAHDSEVWVLGGIDSRLGDTQLAFTGEQSRPLTGSITGQLGTADSLLANMRVGLGEEEGEEGEGVVYLEASNTIALSQSASYQAVFDRVASNTLSLIQEASFTKVVGVEATSSLSLSDEAATTIDSWIFEVAAESTLSISDGASSETDTWIFEASAENTLSLSDAAQGVLGDVYNVAGESSLSLNHSASSEADEWIIDLSAESTLSISDSASAEEDLWIHELTAESTLALSQEALASFIIELAAESTLSLSDEAESGFIYEASAESTMSLSDSAVSTLIHIYEVAAESTLALTQIADRSAIFNRSAENEIVLTQDIHCGRPWHVSAETVLSETRWEFVPDSLELIEVVYGLQDSASVSTILNLGATSSLSLTHEADYSFIGTGGTYVYAESTLEFTHQAWVNQLGIANSQIELTQSASATSGKPVASQIDLGQAAAVTVVRNRNAASELEMSQSASYVLIRGGGVQFCQYAPMVGASDDPDAPDPPPTTLQEPLDGILVPFQLVYPPEGGVTDAVSLRAPNLGNKDRLSFNRIQRETRGGTLTVFADPEWPKTQTLVLDFSGLLKVEATALLDFMESHLGEEVGMIDWEQRYWRGFITTPEEPIIEDRFDQFSASFTFEGELDPTWSPQVVPPTLRVSATRSTEPQNYYVPGEPDVPTEEGEYYEGEADVAILMGQPVYTKSNGHVDLAQADAAGVCQVSGISQNSVGATYSCHYISEGEISQDDWTNIAGTVSLTAGATYFLDPSLPGRITSTPPSTVGHYVVRVGRAVNATTLDIEIELPILL